MSTATTMSMTPLTCPAWCDPVVHDAWSRTASAFLTRVGAQHVLTSTQIGTWVERDDELTPAGWVPGEAVVGLIDVPRTMTPADARELAARLVEPPDRGDEATS